MSTAAPTSLFALLWPPDSMNWQHTSPNGVSSPGWLRGWGKPVHPPLRVLWCTALKSPLGGAVQQRPLLNDPEPQGALADRALANYFQVAAQFNSLKVQGSSWKKVQRFWMDLLLPENVPPGRAMPLFCCNFFQSVGCPHQGLCFYPMATKTIMRTPKHTKLKANSCNCWQLFKIFVKCY